MKLSKKLVVLKVMRNKFAVVIVVFQLALCLCYSFANVGCRCAALLVCVYRFICISIICACVFIGFYELIGFVRSSFDQEFNYWRL